MSGSGSVGAMTERRKARTVCLHCKVQEVTIHTVGYVLTCEWIKV